VTDHEIGYRKPPKHSRFKPGTSGNPKGRPRRKPSGAAEVIKNALSALIQYREQGRVKTTTRTELGLRMIIDAAVKGNLAAADHILTIRAHAHREGDVGIERFEISDSLPDYRGQTAEQKTTDVASDTPVDAPRWWVKKPPDPIEEPNR
jgi:hypothetical protein